MSRQNKVVAAALVAAFCMAMSVLAEPYVSGAGRFPDQAGELLHSELRCASCHGRDPNPPAASLVDLSSRVQHDWVVDFLAEPPHGRMPAMFASVPEADRDGAIRDVTAWLGTLGKGIKFKVQRHSDAERGGALYHEIGCVACHAPTADFKPVRKASPYAVPLPDLQEKTSLDALTDFLLRTNRYRPDHRMPQLPMAGQEAVDIAAHLMDLQGSDPREAAAIARWPKADQPAIERGRALVEKLNCAACHELPGIQANPPRALAGVAGGCLGDDGSVRYSLSEKQRESLTRYLGKKKVDHRSEYAMLAGLNCYACHERDGAGGPSPETDAFFVGDVALADAGRMPPPLTGVGRKLRPEWMRAVLAGENGSRVRPYLKTRMPVYTQAVSDELVQHFARDVAELPAIAKVDDLAAGKKLLGTDGGVNCITCHRWGDRASLGIQGMDISELDRRLQPAWFRSFLLEPSRYRTGTLMPPLWPGGKSTIPAVLDGDAEKQIGAIWAFISEGKGYPQGYVQKGAGRFELVPEDRPIIQRTFLEGVGTHAILIGFPGGISVAYDAEKAQPRLVWRGRFFDAYNTWFSRFAPFEKPLETELHWFGETDQEARFLGYEIDAAGNPTFLSQRNGVALKERFEVRDATLVRTLEWDSQTKLTYNLELKGVRSKTESSSGRTEITHFWK